MVYIKKILFHSTLLFAEHTLPSKRRKVLNTLSTTSLLTYIFLFFLWIFSLRMIWYVLHTYLAQHEAHSVNCWLEKVIICIKFLLNSLSCIKRSTQHTCTSLALYFCSISVHGPYVTCSNPGGVTLIETCTPSAIIAFSNCTLNEDFTLNENDTLNRVHALIFVL